MFSFLESIDPLSFVSSLQKESLNWLQSSRPDLPSGPTCHGNSGLGFLGKSGLELAKNVVQVHEVIYM